ncbi:MAG TPA: cobyric acid synthase [Ktedonobacteraceae bacterium]
MKLAKTLMIQGTASTVGKSTLVTGLCRIFAQDGWRVAPFKAQNMALNSWVTRSGGEIGRAQAVQAEAAGIEPTIEMNPVLLKPEGHSRSQVIVMGRPLASMQAREYYRDRATILPVIEQALVKLRQEYDLVIIEGAGSPVELNLVANDLVNMRVARLADAPVLLVGDIDRGGIFASLLGTLMLLEPADRARVKGLIVNKFRGDFSLWRPGEQLLAERSGISILGTLPFFNDIHIAEEDTVALDEGSALLQQPSSQLNSSRLEIVVVRFPYLSNYDEFDALAADARVHLYVAASPAEFPSQPDLIILPGTKNTLSDLSWLWHQGLAQHIRFCAQKGAAILGICGGYQMLGEHVVDTLGIENPEKNAEPGLNLLPVSTVFPIMHEKITQRCQAQVAVSSARGLFAHLSGHLFHSYQIHVGRSMPIEEDRQGSHAFTIDTSGDDGWLSADGWCAGCYLHGLFENDGFKEGLITALASRRAIPLLKSEQAPFNRQHEYDKLADVLRSHLDIEYLKGLIS